MGIKQLFVGILFTVAISKANAHALWIETNPIGIQHKNHEVKIFFGEYGSNERDTTAKWFSNLRDFTLWVTAPSGKKQQLTNTAAIDFCKAVFTTEETGIYTLSISLEVRDPYRKSKIQYYASATVSVGASAVGSSNITQATDVALQPKSDSIKTGTPVTINLFLKGQPLAKSKISIVSPTGIKTDIETDASGAITFTPNEAGTYMLEGFYIVKENGMQNGKEYTSIYHCITTCVYVSK